MSMRRGLLLRAAAVVALGAIALARPEDASASMDMMRESCIRCIAAAECGDDEWVKGECADLGCPSPTGQSCATFGTCSGGNVLINCWNLES